ncbi:hypothetical protein COP1_036530 [Malus domestica]
MNIGVNVKKYRAVKEVGKILMSVGVIAYFHQMQVCQSDQQFDPNKAAPPFANQLCLKTKKERLRSSLEKSSGVGSSSSCNSERKRQKMKKMVRALRGIVPGGNEMNTVAVLDEAVQYLKSLKVELQKIGVENLNN